MVDHRREGDAVSRKNIKGKITPQTVRKQTREESRAGERVIRQYDVEAGRGGGMVAPRRCFPLAFFPMPAAG